MRIVVPIAAIAITAALGGCVAPVAYQAGGAAARTDIDIPKCDVRVGFSGVPRQFNSDEVEILKRGSGFAPSAVEGWVSDRSPLWEAATCACRESPFSLLEINGVGAALVLHPYAKNVQVKQDGVGAIVEYEEPNASLSVSGRSRLVFPFTAPSCVVTLTARGPQSTAAVGSALLFSRVGPIPKQAAINSPVAERLRQLDKLLSDGLITRAEYDERRRVILSQL